MNSDHFPFANQTALVPAIWYYATGIFSLLCLLCGLLTNGLVIFVFIRNTNLRRPRNFFLINLAVTDLGLLFTNNTLHIIASFNKQWPFGQIGCNFYGLFGGICGLTSIATMVAISLTRLAAVTNPFSSLKLTGHFALKCIVCTWIYGSIWLIPPLFGWSRYIFEGFGTTCTFDYISKNIWNRLYILILVTGGFLIPLIIILISYTFILIKLSKRSRHSMYQNSNDQNHQLQSKKIKLYYFHPTNPLNDERSRNGTIIQLKKNNQIIQNLHRTEVRVTRTALLVCTIFCAAWGPYALMTILSQFGFNYFTNAYTAAMLGLFTKTAACINPLVYAFSSSAFHRQICGYVKYFYTSRESNHLLLSFNYELNRRNVILKINLPVTLSNSSHQ